jgi:hypothetical protein
MESYIIASIVIGVIILIVAYKIASRWTSDTQELPQIPGTAMTGGFKKFKRALRKYRK